MKRVIGSMTVLALVLLMAACASRQRASELDETLRHYGTLIRWNEFAAAADYYDPELRRDRPISRLEMERLSQFRVSGYQQRGFDVGPDGMRATQLVEIRLYNVHDLTERVIMDRQVWRYDEGNKRWWLTSGLPDVTAGRDARQPRGVRQ